MLKPIEPEFSILLWDIETWASNIFQIWWNMWTKNGNLESSHPTDTDALQVLQAWLQAWAASAEAMPWPKPSLKALDKESRCHGNLAAMATSATSILQPECKVNWETGLFPLWIDVNSILDVTSRSLKICKTMTRDNPALKEELVDQRRSDEFRRAGAESPWNVS